MNGDVQYEEWRPVVGWEGRYEVSSQGRVRNTKGRIIKPNLRSGYNSIVLHRPPHDFQRNVAVHRLVAAAFIGPSNGLPVVRHLDGDRFNNTPDNLAWGTYSDNNQDTVRQGRHHKQAVTHCPRGHFYDEANTMIRKEGTRRCRTCEVARSRRRNDARRVAVQAARQASA